MQGQLDHLVINTRFATDEAAQCFTALGFTLTPRGYHSLGSINHLMMFDDSYLELIGLPLNTQTLRQEVLDSERGIDGLVMRTDAPDDTAAALAQAGLAAHPVQSFGRPVDIDGVEQQARFRAVRLLPGQFAAGRVYYCQHLTPELVWRSEWLKHANGVHAITALSVIGDAATLPAAYARLGEFDPARGFALRFETATAFAERFGALARFAPKRADYFGAITLRTRQLQEIANRAATAGLPSTVEATRVVVALPELDTLLEFVN